jgi:phosphoribosylformylglycinamidine cyclo-ligase
MVVGAPRDHGQTGVGMAAHHAQRTMRAGADPRFTGAVALFDPRAAGYQDPIQVTASAGLGAKLKIAIATGMHEAVGMDLATNVANSLLAHGGEPLSFHYYHSSGSADHEIQDRLLAGMAEGCRMSGMALAGGHSAELPGVFEEGEYDLAGFGAGMVERPALLPRFDITEGDTLLGLAASGAHAHGFAQVRRIVSGVGLGYRDPAPFAPGLQLGQALLQPTRAYAKLVQAVLRDTQAVKCAIPIGDGGLLGSMSRALPAQIAARIDLGSWRLPPVFQWLRAAGAMGQPELLQTFNCGLGLVLVVDKLRMISALKVLRDMGEKPLAVGTLVARSGGDPVRFSGSLQG